MSRMLMTACLMCSVQQTKEGGSFKRALPSRCTWTSGKDGIWERAKHIWVDQSRGGREQTRAIMAGEVTGREETDREQSGGECCDLRRRKAGKRVCNAERGSGKSERSKIVHIKKCEVKSSGYSEKEKNKSQDEKRMLLQNLLYFASNLIECIFPPADTQHSPVKCIKANV